MLKEIVLPPVDMKNFSSQPIDTNLIIMSHDFNVNELVIPFYETNVFDTYEAFYSFQGNTSIIIQEVFNHNNEIRIPIVNEVRRHKGIFTIELNASSASTQATLLKLNVMVKRSNIDSNSEFLFNHYYKLFEDYKKEIAELNNATQSTIKTQLKQSQDNLQKVSKTLIAVNDKVMVVNDTADGFMLDVATKQADVTSKYNAFDTSVTQAGQTIDDILALQPQFQAVIDETTGKDVISAPEIILARGGAQSLGERLDSEKAEVTAQLAQTSRVINVKEQFNVKGDGVVDDTQNIQQALDFASQFNTPVYFPEGDYLISGPLELKGRFSTVFGEGTLLLSTLTSGFRGVLDNLEIVNIQGIHFDGTLYGTYAEHYDEPHGLRAIGLTAKKVIVTNCYFENIYGTGINCEGIPYISNNTFIDVAGHNPRTDENGEHDNYGDAIWCGGVNGETKIGVIKNNYMKTTNIGRAGIVVEFSPNMIVISNNYIDGYNQSIHLETCETVIVKENYAINNTTALLVTDATATIENNQFFSGMEDVFLYNLGVIYFYKGGSGSTIKGNLISNANSKSPRAIIFTPTNNNNVSIVGNEIIGGIEAASNEKTVIAENTIRGNVDLVNCREIDFSRNRLYNSRLVFSQATSWELRKNVFYNEGIFSNTLLEASNIKGGNIVELNEFVLASDSDVSFVFISYLGSNVQGDNYFNGNIIRTNKDVRFFQYNDMPDHQPYRVKQLNYRINSDGLKEVILFQTKYDKSGVRKETYYRDSIPTSGSYNKGDIVHNTYPNANGFIGWVCTESGSPGIWKGFGSIET